MRLKDLNKDQELRAETILSRLAIIEAEGSKTNELLRSFSEEAGQLTTELLGIVRDAKAKE